MIRIRQVKINIEKDSPDFWIQKVAKTLFLLPQDILHIMIHKKSLDARQKGNLFYVYEFDVEVENEEKVLKKCASIDIMRSKSEIYMFPKPGMRKLLHRPIIVGCGPAGFFAAYLLAENGYAPILIERGECVENRVKTVESFWNTGVFDENSNVQFGEGGAGTFSDGKLNTLVKDPFFRGKKVFDIFVKHGAPKEILYENHPHIGTDILRTVVKNMRDYILNKGGQIYYKTKLTNLIIERDQIIGIEVNQKEVIDCDVLVLALGHSARDTFEMLYQRGLLMRAKPFAIGLRVQHPQNMIDDSQYGSVRSVLLPKASYKLTYKSSMGRGVYSFCMCPGGYVVNASSEKGRLVINGMSNYARDSENANSAIVVTISPADFGSHPLDGIRYQRNLEQKAYQIGQGKIPVQLWGDFYKNQTSTHFKEVSPVFKGDYCFANLNDIFPTYICDAIKESIPFFDKKIKGYAREDAILAAIESRTSSPVRLERDENLVANIKGIYPCGEGAGYAGGITTSAMDGVKVAEAIARLYQKWD